MLSRTLIHKCDLSLAKDNIGYMIVILATHSDPSFKTKNPNILAKPFYCKEDVGDVLPLDPKNKFSIGQHGERDVYISANKSVFATDTY